MKQSQAEESREPCKYIELCLVFERIEATSKRLQIQEILKQHMLKLIRENRQTELLYSVYLCINRIAPVYKGLELGIGETLLVKAISNATGKSVQDIKTRLAKQGDLGKVIQLTKRTINFVVKPKPLTLKIVFQTLQDITLITGSSAVQRKLDKIQYLLVSCNDKEAKYMTRSLEGKLRIGLAEQSVLACLAQAFYELDPKGSQDQAVEILKSVFNELPDYEVIVPNLFRHGIFGLKHHCHMTPGIPIRPMLAFPARSLAEVLDRFENLDICCEYKYDGERAQVHCLETGKVAVYSRNLENVSGKYPDLVPVAARAKHDNVHSFVLDCEVVGWDLQLKRHLPFQILATRKRKDVCPSEIRIKICLYAFDLLALNGESLLERSLEDRRQMMVTSFDTLENEFMFARSIKPSSDEQIEGFLDQALEEGCEGLMIKTLKNESTYEPSKRSRHWLKVKKDYLNGMGDSIDLVVIGGYHGKGKRRGVFGGFLLAAFDPKLEKYQPVCKLGTGFSELDLESLSEELKTKCIKSPKFGYEINDKIQPDVWFEAVHVWEIRAADLTTSPLYPCGRRLLGGEKGISLRFPRFVRNREDKTPEQCTTAEEVVDMYMQQHHYANGSKLNEVSDEK